MKKVLLIYIISITFLNSYAKFDYNTNCKDAYKLIFDLSFDEGKKVLESEKNTNPKNLIPYYLENYIDFLSLFISEEEKQYKEKIDNRSKLLDKLSDSELTSSPYFLFTQAEVRLQWAFVNLKFGNYTKAGYDIKQAYNLLSKNAKKFPEFHLNKKCLGLLHAIIGTVPEEYKVFVNIIGLEGTINKGINELHNLYNECEINSELKVFKKETLFYLMFAEQNLNRNKSMAITIANGILETKEDNPLLIFASSSIFAQEGKNDKVISVLNNRKSNTYKFYYLDFLYGKALLNSLNKDAITHLNKFINNFKGINYINSCNQKIAWYYLINNNKSKYNEYIIKCKNNKYNVEEDKSAYMEAKRDYAPNIDLLKARLLFDGGYYKKSLKTLYLADPLNTFKTETEKVEYLYRLARIYHKIERIDLAIQNYNNTIKTGKHLKEYFSANSALKLGNIYEEQKKYIKALEYYNMTSLFNNTEYKNSIEQKAKSGINRINSLLKKW